MSANFNNLSAASRKLHLYAVHVLQNFQSLNMLPEDFVPMNLDTCYLESFDANSLTTAYKALHKKGKMTKKIVSSPREDVVNAIATDFYKKCSLDDHDGDDIVTKIVEASKPSDATEKKKRGPNKKKSEVVDSTEPVAPTEKPKKSRAKKVAEPAVAEEAADEPVAEKPKKSRPKKVAEPAEEAADEPAAEKPKRSRAKKVAEPAVTEDAAAEPAAEKPKRSRAKKVAAPAEPAVAEEAAAEPVAEKPKKTRAKKVVPEPVVEEVKEPVTVEEPVAEKPIKTRAKKLVPEPVVAVSPTPEIKESTPILEDKDDSVSNDSDSEEEEEEEDEIEAKVFIYNEKKYLIDDNMNIYDINNFEELGVYDSDKKVINFNE